MTKRERTVSKALSKNIKSRLETVLKRIQSILDRIEHRTSNDAENLSYCLVAAKLKIEEGSEFYTTFI